MFGATLPLENHAWMAVQSALDMRYRLQDFNLKRQAQGQPPIQVGIGISSGEVVSGNIGSQRRMDYTVIGDGVDISSRLEGVTKEYGCDIILSEYTYEFCRDQVWVRELDWVCVKGKTKPLRIYELIADRNEPLDSQTADFVAAYHAGRIAYLNRDFQQALHQFEAAQTLRPHDRSVRLQLQRTQQWLLNPPPEAWDGVYMLVTK